MRIILISCGALIVLIGSIFLFPKTIYFLEVTEFVKETLHPIEKEKSTIKVLFVGDIMMDRSIRRRAETVGYDFYYECVAPTFSNYDFVVANLESTVTEYPSVSIGKPQEDYDHFRFTVDPNAIESMRKAGINVLGVDNNHIYDFGKEGIEMTRKYVTEAGLHYFGDPIDEHYSNLRLEKEGVAFNLVSFNEFFGSVNKTVKNIENVTNQNEPVIVFAHWGDEYIETALRVKDWARMFVDKGADTVIGMHPHVPQGTEIYQDKFIAYSIGNFIFDQYFSEEVQRGLAVEIVLNEEGIMSTKTLNVTLDSERRPCISE